MLETLRAWFERRRAFRELRASEGRESKGFTSYFSEQIDLAKREFDVGRKTQALEIWRRMHARFSDLTLTSEKALNLFIDLGFHDETEALIQEGRRRYPRYRSLYAASSARAAYRRGDREEALRRYDIVRRKYPSTVDGYSVAANCLVDLGREDEADAILRLGVRKVPQHSGLCVQYAQAATRRRDWSEGLRRWELVRRRHNYAFGPIGVAQCLKQLGRMTEAENVLIEACERFATTAGPFAELAKLSTEKGDHAEAARRWDVVLRQFPMFEAAYMPAAQTLREAGRDAEADRVLYDGMRRCPANLNLSLECARSADRRADWAAASERWAVIRERFPACAEAREREIASLAELERQSGSGGVPITPRTD